MPLPSLIRVREVAQHRRHNPPQKAVLLSQRLVPRPRLQQVLQHVLLKKALRLLLRLGVCPNVDAHQLGQAGRKVALYVATFYPIKQ
jgi:hypothetical protein